MTDYAELLATKSQELAELTRAFNQHDYIRAESICRNLTADFSTLILIARHAGGL